jgi:RNA polymerase sigma factor (sigma-70 family)
MVRESNINKKEFEKFLHWLDADREAAGQKYELIRSSLIRIFYARGCYDAAEELADESIDRVIRKIDKIAEIFEGEPARYCHGVAKNVFLEYLRGPKTAELPPDIMAQIEVDMTETETDIRRLHKCLKKLKPEQRKLIVKYYKGEKGDNIKRRKEIEQELNITNDTLRIRIHRIKKFLHECIQSYSKQENR